MDKPVADSSGRAMLFIVVLSVLIGLGAGYRSESIAGFLIGGIFACLALSAVYALVARVMRWKRLEISDLATLLFFLPP